MQAGRPARVGGARIETDQVEDDGTVLTRRPARVGGARIETLARHQTGLGRGGRPARVGGARIETSGRLTLVWMAASPRPRGRGAD